MLEEGETTTQDAVAILGQPDEVTHGAIDGQASAVARYMYDDGALLQLIFTNNRLVHLGGTGIQPFSCG